jgi:hypothetical protein
VALGVDVPIPHAARHLAGTLPREGGRQPQLVDPAGGIKDHERSANNTTWPSSGFMMARRGGHGGALDGPGGGLGASDRSRGLGAGDRSPRLFRFFLSRLPTDSR